MRRFAVAAVGAALAVAGCRQVLGIPGDFTGSGISIAGEIRGADGATPAMIYLAIDGVAVDSLAVTADGPLDLRTDSTGTFAVTADPTCSVENGTGTLTDDGVDDVIVTCDGLSALRALGLSSPLELTFASPTLSYDVRVSPLTQASWLAPVTAYPDATIARVALDATEIPLTADGYGPIGFLGATALAIEVSHPDVDDHAYMLSVDEGEIAEFGYGKPSASVAAAWFGNAIAADRDVVVVGAPEEESQAGRAFVYRRTGQAWVEEAALVASDAAAGARFGTAVAVARDVIAIGAPGAGGTGAAYLYRRTGGQWVEARIAGGAAQDQFGTAVAVAGDVAAIGAPGDDGAGAGAGAAFVYAWSGSSWTQQRRLDAPVPDPGAAFGASIAANADWVIVGAPLEDTMTLVEPGGAYAFAAPAFTAATAVVPSPRHPGDRFGTAVAIAADGTVAVGAPQADVAGAAAGLAYLFHANTFVPTAEVAASNPQALDGFGAAVAIAGRVLAVGAPQEDSGGATTPNESASAAGAAYVYPIDAAGAVDAPTYVKASNIGAGDQFGAALCLTTEQLVVGAPFEDSGTNGWSRLSDGANNGAAQAGAVYAFR